MVVLSKYWSQASKIYDGLSSNQTACVAAAATLGVTMAFQKWRTVVEKSGKTVNINQDDDERHKTNKSNPAVNKQFFKQLKVLLKVSTFICILLAMSFDMNLPDHDPWCLVL